MSSCEKISCLVEALAVCNIFIFVSSGLSLLFVQYLNDNKSKLGLDMISCCWILSGWFNIAGDTTSYKDNENYDGMIVLDKDIVLPKMASCYIDNNGDIYPNAKNKDLKKWAKRGKISSVNGKFNKYLCPLYLMVGATELLLDDSIDVANKAYKNDVDVQLDIAPYMFHTWPLFINQFDEAIDSVVRGANFINNHLS